MTSYYSELRYKEVIDIHTGLRLGYVCDLEFDDAEGRLVSLVTPGRSKFFGLLGREDDYVLPWGCIVASAGTSSWWRPRGNLCGGNGSGGRFFELAGRMIMGYNIEISLHP